MTTRTPLPRCLIFRSIALAWGVGLGLALVVPDGMAQSSKSKKGADDSGPILMSRTGGGGWSNMKQLEEAVARGNPTAEAQLGEYLLRGDGVKQDLTRGLALLEKSAKSGNAKAAFRLGMTLTNGEFGVPADAARGLDYFRAAAAGGESDGFFNIGAAYANGKGVKRDYGEALGWLIVARQRGADGSTETQLRERIKTVPQWIARGERRAKEIEAEFTDKTLQDYLPGAKPVEKKVPDEPKPTNESLKPPADAFKPALPGIQPPQIK